MYVDIEDFKNGWYGIGMGISIEEIDVLIHLLLMLKAHPDQHFHISSEYKGSGGVGDIEVYLKDKIQNHNMIIMGKARGPGEEV
jgi:hypothetical protein